jgi:hypothetical protein
VKLRALAALLAAALILPACGGEDGSDEDQIRAVAADYLRAIAAGDGEALCDASSETEQTKILLSIGISEEDVDDCVAAVNAQGKPFTAEDYEAMAAEMDGAEVTIEDSVAVVQLPVSDDNSSGGGPYLLFAVDEGGEWKVDEVQ